MSDPRIKQFGANVRRARKNKGLSQENFANQAGIDRSYMGHIERGEKNVTLLKAFQIADTLNVTLKELLGDT